MWIVDAPTCTAREHFLWRLAASYPTRNEGTSVSMTKSVDKTHIGVQSYPHSVGLFQTQHSSLFIPSWGFSKKKTVPWGTKNHPMGYLLICETNCFGDPNFKQSSCIVHPEIWWFTINKDIDKFGMMNNTFGTSIWLGLLKISAIRNLMFVRFFTH